MNNLSKEINELFARLKAKFISYSFNVEEVYTSRKLEIVYTFTPVKFVGNIKNITIRLRDKDLVATINEGHQDSATFTQLNEPGIDANIQVALAVTRLVEKASDVLSTIESHELFSAIPRRR